MGIWCWRVGVGLSVSICWHGVSVVQSINTSRTAAPFLFRPPPLGSSGFQKPISRTQLSRWLKTPAMHGYTEMCILLPVVHGHGCSSLGCILCHASSAASLLLAPGPMSRRGARQAGMGERAGSDFSSQQKQTLCGYGPLSDCALCACSLPVPCQRWRPTPSGATQTQTDRWATKDGGGAQPRADKRKDVVSRESRRQRPEELVAPSSFLRVQLS